MKMVRSLFIALLLVGAASLAQAQPKIGVLSLSTREAAKPTVDAFRQRLAELGHADGTAVRFVERYANDDVYKLRRLAADLVSEGVAVLYAPSTPDALAAKGATRSIPIVFSNVNDPVIVKLVDSYPRPGGNVTGIAQDTNTLGAKRLQYLKELVPGAQRVALLFDKDYADACRLEVDQIQGMAKELKLDLDLVPFEGSGTLEAALAKLRSQRPHALLSPVSGTFAIDGARIGAFLREHRIPALVEPLDSLEHGAILSYGPDTIWASRRAAEYVSRILKGTKPAELPVERPTRYELVINQKMAKALGLQVPQTLLLQATRVIE